MFKLIGLLCNPAIIALAMTLINANADADVIENQRPFIEEAVFADKGWYDEVEIEKRMRMYRVEQPLPQIEGTEIPLFCKPCTLPPSNSTPDTPQPEILNIQSISYSVGSYASNYRLKIRSTPGMTAPQLAALQKYEIFVFSQSSDDAWQSFVNLQLKPNGDLPKKQFVRFRNFNNDTYSIYLRAVYDFNGSYHTSEWTPAFQVTVNDPLKEVGNLSASSALRQCILDNGYTDTTLFRDVTRLDCTGKGLTPADKADAVANLVGLRYFNIANNPLITEIAGMGDMPHLEWLDVSDNPQMDVSGASTYGPLLTFEMRNMGATAVPALPYNATFIDMSSNQITAGYTNLISNNRDWGIDVLDISRNPLEDGLGSSATLFSELNQNTVVTLNAGHSQLDQINGFSDVAGLQNLYLDDTDLSGNVALDAFAGFCQLSLNDSDIVNLTGTRPIQYLSMQNSRALDNIATFFPFGLGNEDKYLSNYYALEHSTTMNCVNYLSLAFWYNLVPHVDMQSPIVVDMGGGQTQAAPVCRDYAAADYLNLPESCQALAPAELLVTQDNAGHRRYIAWEEAVTYQSFADWGMTHFIVRAFDDTLSNGVLLKEWSVPIEAPWQITHNDFSPLSYTVQACDAYQCGLEATTSTFTQAVVRVSDLSHEWFTDDPNNLQFNIRFKYPSAVFDTVTGKPDYFKVTPVWPQSDPQAVDVIIAVAGVNGNCVLNGNKSPDACHGTVVDEWVTPLMDRNVYLGDEFIVEACSDVMGCGLPSSVVLGEALSSADLPVPVLLTDPGPDTDTEILLQWTLSGAHVDDVDYLEIIEKQASISVDSAADNSMSAAGPESKYYTEELSLNGGSLGQLRLKRLINGYYQYKLRSCKRDRENGDICSASSNVITLAVDRRAQYTFASLSHIDSSGDYVDSSGYRQIWWSYDQSAPGAQTPDYFYLEAVNSTSTCFTEMDGNGQPIHDTDKLIIEHDEFSQTGNNWYTEWKCKRFATFVQSQGYTDPVGSWLVKACVYGTGCGNPVTVTFSPSQQSGPPGIYNPVLNPVGGPGDMSPGVWWNPEQAGTGWHFYWASELRYPSVHENYGETYDLLGYWFAYHEVDGVWTPVWFFSNMKLSQETGNDQIFRGDLLYLNYFPAANGNPPYTEKQVVGVIEVLFNSNNSDNQHVDIRLDLDYEGGIFSQLGLPEDGQPFSVDKNGKLQYSLQDFAIGGVNANDAGNESDHYKGVWILNDNGVLDERLTMLTWIDKSIEVTTIATYDTAGKPFWLQAASCYDSHNGASTCSNTIPGAGLFTDYAPDPNDNTDYPKTFTTVATGFNPLGRTPDGYDVTQEIRYVGRGGRNFTQYREGGLFLDIQYVTDSNTPPAREVNLSLGTEVPFNPVDIDKIASLHDIRFFINGQDESVTTCDPNDPAGPGECVIHLTWFTDDDFTFNGVGFEVIPYYSYSPNSNTISNNYMPLSDICGVVPGGYVVKRFECTFTEAGNYKFQLRKEKYNESGTVDIAASQALTINACNSAHCSGNNGSVEPPAEPPAIADMIDALSYDPANDLVGTTAGAFDVDESGAANYSIPIFTPSGRGGVTPQLSLNYHSNSGNGIAGMGWSIGGTSAITRCLKSPEHDPGLDFYPSIQLNNDDAFCLDGMRLLLASGVYGESGSTYRTEIESFNNIQLIEDSTNGRHFKVYSKSGEVRMYGSSNEIYQANVIFNVTNDNDTGAQIIANDTSGTIHTWLLNEIKDKYENKIRFYWDTMDGENYLSLVKWSNINTAQDSHYEVQFNYSTATKADAMHHYGIGTEYKGYKFLQSISTFIREDNLSGALNEVRRLKLDYEQSTVPGETMRLSSVSQCLNSTVCLEPVEFEWDGGDTNFGFDQQELISSTQVSKLSEMGFGSFKPIDINGDGKSELIFIRGYDDGNIIFENLEARFWVAYNSVFSPGPNCEPTTGYFNYICDMGIEPFDAESVSADQFNAEKWFVYDFNGDGHQDLLTPIFKLDGVQYSNWFIVYSDGDRLCTDSCGSLAPNDTGIQFHDHKAGSTLLDFTADGLPDFMTIASKTVNGETLYQYKLFPMVRNANEFQFATDAVNAKFVEVDSSKLYPKDMICNFGSNQNPLILPCMYNVELNDLSGFVLANKLEVVSSDFNGDGYNDAILSYTFRYTGINGQCQYQGPSGVESAQPLGEYTTESSTAFLGSSSFDRCEQKFKVAMIFNIKPDGTVQFKYAGRIGIVNVFTDDDINNDQSLPVVECEDGEFLECYGVVHGRMGGYHVMDINGDGFGDIMYLSHINGYRYMLNKGKLTPVTVPDKTVSNIFIEGYQYDKLEFTGEKIIVLPPTGGGLCTTENLSDSDQNQCARRFLTQFIDYDMDGDVDMLYPDLTENSGTDVLYKLKTYQWIDGDDFGYVDRSIQPLTSYLKSEQPQHYINTIMDLDGDGANDYFSLFRGQTSKRQVFIPAENAGASRNKITSFNSPLNQKEVQIKVDYKPATSALVYQHQTGSLNSLVFGQGSPVFDVLSNQHLVHSVEKSAPIEGDPTATAFMYYHYEGLKVQGGGRGSLGFSSVRTYDPNHDVTIISNYRQDFPYIGMADSSYTMVGHLVQGNLLIGEALNDYDKVLNVNNTGSVFPYLKRSAEKSYEAVFGTPGLKVIINDFTYGMTDNAGSSNPGVFHGNLTGSDTRVCKGDTELPEPGETSELVCGPGQVVTLKTTVNKYDHDDPANWLLGRLSETTVESTRYVGNNTMTTKSKTSSFNYDSVTGQLTEERIHGNASQDLRTVYAYDAYGQQVEKFLCSSDVVMCDSVPTVARQANSDTVHRYSKTDYDPVWNEYVEKQYEPFTSYTPFTDADTADLENGLYVFDPGTVQVQAVMSVQPYNGVKRDIYGNPLMVSDVFGTLSRTVYGRFGEAFASASETGGMSQTSRAFCNGTGAPHHCPTGAALVVITEASGAPMQRKYTDVLGREIRAQVQNMHGNWMTTDTYYDRMGRTVKQSEPYLRSPAGARISPDYYTTTEYDALDRVVRIVSPNHCSENITVEFDGVSAPICEIGGNEVITTTEYSGLSVTTTNPKGQEKTQVFDESGKVITAIDADGEIIEYTYDSLDNLITTTSHLNASSITITMYYDALGRKTSMDDPDKGFWAYTYNAAGEQITQTNARLEETTMSYDIRGRLYHRSGDAEESVWQYDLQGPGLLDNEFARGHKSQSGRPNQFQGAGQDVQYFYDVFGRPSDTTTTVYDGDDGVGLTPSAVQYTASVTYDQFGRVFQRFDATGEGVLMQYNDYGYQTITRDAANGLNGQVYQQILDTDSRGNVIRQRNFARFETVRNYADATGFLQTIQTRNEAGELVQDLNFAFDKVGNLIRRSDLTPDNGVSGDIYSETFQYDALNRLTKEFLEYNATPETSYQYDATGNLINKSDVSGANYQYHANRPHALESVAGNTYQYDANGNMTSRTGASAMTIHYTHFDKPYRIEADGWVSKLDYNAGRSRYYRLDFQPGNAQSRRMTHYLGGMEFIYKADGSKTAKRYIGNLVIAIEDDSTNRNEWDHQYLLKDHIGSTHTVVNKQGFPVAHMSFNAWGQRRQPALPSSPVIFQIYPIAGVTGVWAQLGATIDATTNRGFTGHEHFDQVGIIHMNGRIYDPVIGRFLQADPLIQDPFDTQSLNRYSYVMNNPLSYTDPTGYARLRKGWWRLPVAIAITVYTAGAASSLLADAMLGQAFAVTVLGGAVSGGVATGSLKGALKGALFAAVTFGIGHGRSGLDKGGNFVDKGFFKGELSTILAHSVASGISAELDGGKFGHGFLSSGVSQLAQSGSDNFFKTGEIVVDIVSNAILQGVISEAIGGKFANGAVAGAFRAAASSAISNNAAKEISRRKALIKGITVQRDSNIPGYTTGVTAEDISEYQHVLWRVAGTSRGTFLLSNIQSREGNFSINLCRGCGITAYSDVMDILLIDVGRFHPVQTVDGIINNANPYYILPHELGHAGTWTTDPATIIEDTFHPDFPIGRNAVENENPILKELGMPLIHHPDDQ